MVIIFLMELVMLLNTSIASSANVLPTCVALLSIADCACVAFTPSSASSCSIFSYILLEVGRVRVKPSSFESIFTVPYIGWS
jgi:predicted solute-binding protein